MEINNVRVEYTKLSEILEADRNVKDHDIGAIHESMNRFGFTSPLLLNESSGKLVAGHGRIEALKQKKQFSKNLNRRTLNRLNLNLCMFKLTIKKL